MSPSMRDLILNIPPRIGPLGRAVRQLDVEPGAPEKPKPLRRCGLSVAEAKALAHQWATIPCDSRLVPVQKVLRVLLDEIQRLECES